MACTAMLAGLGLPVAAQQRRPDGVDLLLPTTIFGRQRLSLARVSTDTATTAALADLHAASAEEGCTDYLLIAPFAEPALAASPHVLHGDGLTEQLRRSWVLDELNPGQFVLNRSAWSLLSRIDRASWPPTAALLRAVLALARNTLPLPLVGHGTADDQFERAVFDLLTGPLHLVGRRMGSASRGSRVGDALIAAPGCARPALVDCKAARRMYRMDIDDERRLVEYATSSVSWNGSDVQPSRVVVISSEFGPQNTPAGHPFHRRRAALRATGSDLAYVRVDDLVAAVLELDPLVADDTDRVANIDWARALSDGLVGRDALLSVVRSA